MKKVFVSLLLVSLLIACKDKSSQKVNLNEMWYDEPATEWVNALPLGNGRIGAMVYGDPMTDQIQLNEETIWAGEPGNNVTPKLKDVFPKIRELLFEGKYEEAQELADKEMPFHSNPDNNYGMCYQTAGSLLLHFPQQEVTNYKRSLDLETAISKVSYTSEGTTYKREYLTSYNDDVLIIKLSANKPKQINCTLSLNGLLANQISVKDYKLYLRGQSGNHENKTGKVKYTTVVYPKIKGGELISTDSTLQLKNVDEATIYLSIGTNFKNFADIS
ncbi:MAG: glycoside hydrolase family 95 protein, partial [Carboxylicivirga sp.]|nr:glycoside hydrolase family 95 protein [Carboxylicivirga sp.]